MAETDGEEERARVRDMLRARLNAPPPPPLEATRAFLGGFCSDAFGLDEVRADLTRLAAVNTRGLIESLTAIDALLDDPPPAGTLSRIVAWDGNWKLEDPSDSGAANFLRQLADMVREILGDESPPRETGIPKGQPRDEA